MAQIIDEGSKALDDILIVGGLVVGGILVWKFWPVVKASADATEKLGETAGGIIDSATDVTTAIFSGDWDGAVEGFEEAPIIGGASKALRQALGVKTIAEREAEGAEIKKEIRMTCKADDSYTDNRSAPVDAYPILHTYNDWRPEENQKAFNDAIKKRVGTASQIWELRNNHLIHGVRNGQGGITSMIGDAQMPHAGVWFRTIIASTAEKEQCEIQGCLSAPIGIAYILYQVMGDEYKYSSHNQQQIQILNEFGIHAEYFAGQGLSGLEQSFVNQLQLTYDVDNYGLCIFKSKQS
jgi:hypothetical protein